MKFQIFWKIFSGAGACLVGADEVGLVVAVTTLEDALLVTALVPASAEATVLKLPSLNP